MVLTPYMPVPETNGEEWDRLEAATGIDALLELIMHGEYNGLDAARRQKERVDLRATAVGVFEVCAPSLVVPITVLLKPLEAFPQGRSGERSDYLGHAPTRECWFANPTSFLLTFSRT
jgi:hypothetical protein